MLKLSFISGVVSYGTESHATPTDFPTYFAAPVHHLLGLIHRCRFVETVDVFLLRQVRPYTANGESNAYHHVGSQHSFSSFTSDI